MHFDDKQGKVLMGMVPGAVIAVLIVAAGWLPGISGTGEALSPAERMAAAGRFLAVPGLALMISIARLARYRFLSPADIDAGASVGSSHKALLLQSMLQNTLEQAVLAGFAYLVWALAMPSDRLSVIALASAAFAIGRLLFFVGYEKGAGARAFGFALTFYPSLLILVVGSVRLCWP